MIKYINIYYEEYFNLSEEEAKINAYCIEYFNGDKEWLVNGFLHREDGPAVIYNNGSFLWFLNNVRFSFKKWCEKLNKTDEEIIFLRIKYGN